MVKRKRWFSRPERDELMRLRGGFKWRAMALWKSGDLRLCGMGLQNNRRCHDSTRPRTVGSWKSRRHTQYRSRRPQE